MKHIKLTDGQIKRLVEALKQTNASKDAFFETSMGHLQKEYAKYEKRKSKLLNKLVDKKIKQEDYDKKITEYHTKQTLLNSQMASHHKADEEYYITCSLILSLAKRAYRIFKSSEPMEKGAFTNFLLQNCKLQGRNFTFELKKPFNAAVVANKSNNLLPDLDSNQDRRLQRALSYH